MRKISARVTRLIAVGGAMVGLVLLPALSPAAAKAALPKTVPPVLQKTAKNATADALPTAQIDGVVWSQVIIGNKVYAGGKFALARPAGAAPGTQTVPRANLLMYSLKSGVLKSFAPELNGPVKALAASPDGKKLFVAGQFTKVGTAKRLRFAAFDVATGKLLKAAPAFDGGVNALTVIGGTVYAGGWFTAVGTAPRSRLAAFNSTSGKLRRWAPVADDTVDALVATPNKKRVIVGGRFLRLNGTKAWGLAALDAKTAKRKAWAVNKVIKDYGPTAGITSLVADKNTVYGSGFGFGGGNFEGAFAVNPSDGSIKWIEDCHGDTYSVAPIGGVVYTVGHAHFCSNVGGFPETPVRSYHRALAMTSTAKGTLAENGQQGAHYGNFGGQPAPSLFNWFPDLRAGEVTGTAQAAWNVVGNSSYVALGGEFPTVNGVPQQGLVRFAVPTKAPNKSGPYLTGSDTAPTLTADPSGSVAVAWPTNADRDDRSLTYELIRDGVVVDRVKSLSYFWTRLTLSYDDADVVPGRTYRYQVRTIDPDANVALSPERQITVPAPAAAPR